MKRTLLSFFLIAAVCLAAHSQDISSIVKDASRSRVRSEFTYKMSYNGEDFSGRGSIVVQDSCFVLKTSALELYCDSEVLWVLDKDAREVCIQSAEGVDPDVAVRSFGIDYQVVSYVKGDKEKDLSLFSLNVKGLSDDYIITDLR